MMTPLPCLTRACYKPVERTGPWKQSKWCPYAPGYCIDCMQPYWILDLKSGRRIMDRKLNESFDRRTNGTKR